MASRTESRRGDGQRPSPASAPRVAAAPLRERARMTPGRWLAAALLLVAFALQAVVATWRDSVTVDEFLHLPVGLNALYTGNFREDPIDPHVPLVWSALPLLANPPAFAPPPGTHFFGLGYHFMQMNPLHYHRIFETARLMIVLLSLLTAMVMAKWATELYGADAALASLALFAFAPSLLAHGHLVTLDMAGAFGFLLTLYANWKMLEAPSLRRAVLLGAALGFANLLKLSGVVLTLVVLVTWLVRALSEKPALPAKRWLLLLVVAGLSTIVTINVGYGFDGSFSLLGAIELAPAGKLHRLGEALPWLRLPLPIPFLQGVDQVLEVGKGQEAAYFLMGELSADGWWYYHLAAFAAKCPLPVLLLGLFSVGAWAFGRSRGRRDYVVFVPIVLLFAMNSAFNSLYIGERHVLPVYPLLFIGISPWLADGLSLLPRWWSGGAAIGPREKAAAIACALLLAWNVAGTIAVSPRYLQYFNEAAGGPEGGHRVLVDSNIDWGQDLIRLRDYLDEHKIEQISLAYFGRVDPRLYGIRYQPLERENAHGTVVVSATFLMGRPYFWFLGGRFRWVPARTYTWLQQYRPVARVGAMFVYQLP